MQKQILIKVIAMTELSTTWGRLVKIWWLLAWRSLTLGLLAGAFVGFVIGVVGYFLGMDDASIMFFCQPAGFIAGNIVFLLMVKSSFKKRFKGFRLAIVSTEEFILTENNLHPQK